MRKILHWVRGRLPRSLRRLVYRAGNFFGDEFRPLPQELSRDEFPSVPGSLRYLRTWGYQPKGIIDIGAYRGDWTRMAKEIFPSSPILMVEAQESKRPLLVTVCRRYEDVSYNLALLGAQDGVAVDFVEMETGSSVFEERSEFGRTRRRVSTLTLDTVLRDEGLKGADFLKLDVQGYELEILSGASETLEGCEFVLMEASLIPINRGCPLIADVMSFMTERGFRLIDFCSQVRRKDGALWQTDLLFVSNGSKFLPVPELNAENW